jgi:hypothetical protein
VANTRSTRSRRARADAPLEDAASGASEAVRQAAAVLEKELASGVNGVQRLGAHLTEEHRVDQEAFDEVLARLRANTHEFVGVAANRVGDLRADDVQDLAAQFSTHAQDLLDAVINMVSVAPDMLNRVIAAGQQGDPPRAAAASRPAAKAGGAKRPARKAPAKKAPAKKK